MSLDGSLTDRASGQSVMWSGQVSEAKTSAGLCEQLAGKSLSINVNGFNGVIGPSGIPLISRDDGSYAFKTTAAFPNEPVDAVSGNCAGNSLTFSRTRTNAFVQTYTGNLVQSPGGMITMEGSLADQTGQKASWSGQIIEPHP